jgi:hypothetical protein
MAYLGWPFLIGRGRRIGHRVLLAPDFLVATNEHGVLEGISGDTVTRLGLLTVRSATHQVGAADVAGAERPRDEHGRPLRLIYGVVASGVEPANADLPTALAAALATYRRFLHGEDGFTVESAQGFPLAAQPSTVDQRALRQVAQPAQPPRPDRARIAVLSSAAALVAVLAVGSTLLLGQSAEQPPAPPPPLCPTTTVAPTTIAPTKIAPATTAVPATTTRAAKVAPTPSVSVPPAPAPRC